MKVTTCIQIPDRSIGMVIWQLEMVDRGHSCFALCCVDSHLLHTLDTIAKTKPLYFTWPTFHQCEMRPRQ